MRLAIEFRAPLIFLCSSRWVTPADVLTATWLDKDHEVVAIDFAEGSGRVAVEFETAAHVEATRHRTTDVARKRNAALMLGRMLRWDRLLFLDDDIDDLASEQVRTAAAALGPARPVVGWVARNFADNSTVFHARRDAGMDCDQFIGAGALMVDCRQNLSFFPETYNEDWLFLLPHLQRGAVARAGDVRQLGYDPFESDTRAKSEEFGDVLGEGLIHLLHVGHPLEVAQDPLYWQAVLGARVDLIDHIVRLRSAAGTPSLLGFDPAAVLASLDGVKKLHEFDESTRDPQGHTAWSVALADYVVRWRRDCRAWESRWAATPPAADLGQAMATLRLL